MTARNFQPGAQAASHARSDAPGLRDPNPFDGNLPGHDRISLILCLVFTFAPAGICIFAIRWLS